MTRAVEIKRSNALLSLSGSLIIDHDSRGSMTS